MYLRFKKRTTEIHQKLKIDLVQPRVQKLFFKFKEKKNSFDPSIKRVFLKRSVLLKTIR